MINIKVVTIRKPQKNNEHLNLTTTRNSQNVTYFFNKDKVFNYFYITNPNNCHDYDGIYKRLF